MQERYGRFTNRRLTHYLNCAYLAALRGDISAEIVDLMIKWVSQCVDLPAFAQFVLAKNRINPGIFADYDELSEAVKTAILNSLPATVNICAEIKKMEPGQPLTLLALVSKEMSGKAIDNSFHYPAISSVRSTRLLADNQLMATTGLNLKRSKEGAKPPT